MSVVQYVLVVCCCVCSFLCVINYRSVCGSEFWYTVTAYWVYREDIESYVGSDSYIWWDNSVWTPRTRTTESTRVCRRSVRQGYDCECYQLLHASCVLSCLVTMMLASVTVWLTIYYTQGNHENRKIIFDLSMLSNALLSNEYVLAWSQCLLDDIASIYILSFFIN